MCLRLIRSLNKWLLLYSIHVWNLFLIFRDPWDEGTFLTAKQFSLWVYICSGPCFLFCLHFAFLSCPNMNLSYSIRCQLSLYDVDFNKCPRWENGKWKVLHQISPNIYVIHHYYFMDLDTFHHLFPKSLISQFVLKNIIFYAFFPCNLSLFLFSFSSLYCALCVSHSSQWPEAKLYSLHADNFSSSLSLVHLKTILPQSKTYEVIFQAKCHWLLVSNFYPQKLPLLSLKRETCFSKPN